MTASQLHFCFSFFASWYLFGSLASSLRLDRVPGSLLKSEWANANLGPLLLHRSIAAGVLLRLGGAAGRQLVLLNWAPHRLALLCLPLPANKWTCGRHKTRCKSRAVSQAWTDFGALSAGKREAEN